METIKIKSNADVTIMIPSFWQINPFNTEDIIYEFKQGEVKDLPKGIALYQAKVNNMFFEIIDSGYEEELAKFDVTQATKPAILIKQPEFVPHDVIIITPEEQMAEQQVIEEIYEKNEIRKKLSSMTKEELNNYLSGITRTELFRLSKSLELNIDVKFNEKKEEIINKIIEIFHNEN